MKTNPVILFQTERLRARPWDSVIDVDAAFALYGDPEVIKYLGAAPVPVPDRNEMAKRLASRPSLNDDGSGSFALERLEDAQVIGAIIVKWLPDGEGVATPDLEIGWHLARAYWGKGYATEAAREGVLYAFRQFQISCLHSIAYPENVKSIAIMHRLGMAFQGETSCYYGVTASHFTLERPPTTGTV